MTGAAEPRRRPATTLAAVVGAAVVLVTASTACTSAAAPVGATARASGPAAAPGADEPAIRAVIDAVNAAAGGPVEAQQRALADAVDPELAGALDACPAATTTIALEPVYLALRPAPDWSGPTGTPAGRVYLLPTLIRIYAADRITGTDLGTIVVGVTDGTAGEARLAPVCVG